MAMTLAMYINTLPLHEVYEWLAACGDDVDVQPLLQQRVHVLTHARVYDLHTLRVEAQLDTQCTNPTTHPHPSTR